MQLYGFTDENGEWIIKPQYKFACDFSEGLAAVENSSGANKLFGFITTNNHISIPYKYDNVHVEGFKHGVASVAIGDMWGLIDKSGSVVVPFKYHNPITATDRNNEGYTIWKSIGLYSSVFVTTPQNKLLIEGYIFSMDISFLDSEKSLLSVCKSSKYGVYDLNGKAIAECIYDEIGKFDSNGLARFRRGDKYGLMDTSFKEVLCSDYKIQSFDSMERIRIYKGVATNSPDYRCGIMNMNGEILVPVKYKFIDFDISKFPLKVKGENGYYGLLDENWNEILECKYTTIGSFNEDGIAIVKNNNGMGYINSRGEILLDCIYSSIYISNVDKTGLIEVKKGNRKGYLDSNWQVVIPCEYESIGSVDSLGLIRVETNKKQGLITDEGKVVLPCRYYYIGEFNKFGLAIVNTGNTSRPERGAIDKDGNVVIKPKYHDFSDFDDYGEAIVSMFSGTRYRDYGVIDTLGNEVIPPTFDKIHERTGPIRRTQKGYDNSSLATMSKVRYGAYAGNNKIIPCIYNSVDYDSKLNLILVSIINSKGSEKYGYINIEGAVIVKCKYSSKEDAYKKAVRYIK